MKPYFVPSTLGRALKAAGKKFKQEPPFGTWYLRYRDAYGFKQREKSDARTEQEAIRKNVETQQEENDIRDKKKTRRRVQSEMLCDALIALYLAANEHLSSQGPMKSQCRHWFGPHFKSKPVASILPADCDALLVKARKEGLAPNSVRQLHVRGRLIFEYARTQLQAIDVNPWAAVKRPTVPVREVIFLDKAQVRALLVAAGEWRLLFFLAILTGMRRGELGALQWSDVDWSAGANGVIHARRSWSRSTTKGKKARLIPIHPALRPVMEAAAKVATTDIIFPDRNGEMRGETWHTSKLLKAIAERAGVTLPKGMTFHGLRATFLSHIIHGGGDLTAAQRLAGHANPSITERHYLGHNLVHLESGIAALSFGDLTETHKTNTNALPADTQEAAKKSGT